MGGGYDSLEFSTRISCYGCFLPDLTGFTTYRHCSSEPYPPYEYGNFNIGIPKAL